jgi:Domain of unknown function (DUF4412)
MKRAILAVMFAVVAQSAFAGLAYKVESVSSGIRESTMNGTAEVEGKNFRFNIGQSDDAVIPASGFIISENGGRTLAVVDPATKSYYELSLDQIGGGFGAILQQFGGMVKFTVANPKVNVRDLGAGEKIEGYATQHKTFDMSYDMNMDVMGQKTTMSFATTAEMWVTDQIPTESASFLQSGELHTGIDDIDKLIAMHVKSLSGFPLRHIATIHVVQGGNDMEAKTTTTVTGIEKKTFPATEFVIPAGFAKTDSPIDKIVKAMSGAAPKR